MRGGGLLSRSVDETREMGARLARALPGGTVVALVGELGAGKTTLVQGAAEGLGVGARAPGRQERFGRTAGRTDSLRTGSGLRPTPISAGLLKSAGREP